jgi:hypothetical protein
VSLREKVIIAPAVCAFAAWSGGSSVLAGASCCTGEAARKGYCCTQGSVVWWILQRGDQVAGGARGVVAAVRWLVRAAVQVMLREKVSFVPSVCATARQHWVEQRGRQEGELLPAFPALHAAFPVPLTWLQL